MHSHTKRSAFSLVELLIVITIIGIIGTFAVPAIKSMLKGASLNTGASLLVDEVALARQHALTKSRIVEFRFYRFGDPEVPGEKVESAATGYFRAFQFFELTDSGIMKPAGKFKRLPDTIVMNSGVGSFNTYTATSLSSLLGEGLKFNPGYVFSSITTPLTDSDPELPRGVKKNYDYVAFRFLPDGTTSLSTTGRTASASVDGKWFITLHYIGDAGKVTDLMAANTKDTKIDPKMDFMTWMIDPVSGTSKLLRPGLR